MVSTGSGPAGAQVRSLLSQAARVAVLTGAGISAESGIPTFRGPGGIWRTYRAEDLARVKDFALITQNVDGLHDRAGSRNVLKVHGDIWTLRCTVCRREREEKSARLSEIPPRCACGGMERPGVVWFGEALPPLVWERAKRAVQSVDVLLVVGTSAVVHPVTGLAELAKSRGAVVVEVNLAETPVTAGADYSLRGPAAVILAELTAGPELFA